MTEVPDMLAGDDLQAPAIPASNGHIKRVSVLAPGAHQTPEGFFEQTIPSYCEQVFGALPPETVFARSKLLGTLDGPAGERSFVPLNCEKARILVDRYVRTFRWRRAPKKAKGEEVRHVEEYENCTYDQGRLLLNATNSVPEIVTMTNYPTVIREPDGTCRISPAGPSLSGHYYDEPPRLGGLEDSVELPGGGPEWGQVVRAARAVIDDLLIDFRFETEADRQNFIGLLFTPILRPAIQGPVPLHLITGPQPGLGKTILVERVMGQLLLGRRIPAMRLGATEEERDKRLVSLLLHLGDIIHLDNAEDIDSAVLASFITSNVYEGRRLGSSEILTLPNRTTVVATGNAVRASQEMARRVVPIRLIPMEEQPELRRSFHHPDIDAYIAENRMQILGAFLTGAMLRLYGPGSNGDVDGWPALRRKGSFESWNRCVGSVLITLGYDKHLANQDEWAATADEQSADFHDLVVAWNEQYGRASISATEVFELAQRLELFPALFGRNATPKGLQSSFGRQVLGPLQKRVISGKRVTLDDAHRRRYFLADGPVQ